MIFIFLDESEDTSEPGMMRKDGSKTSVYFAIGGIAIAEENLNIYGTRLNAMKRSFFGEEKYSKVHHELKSDIFFGPKYICNDERQRFSKALSRMLRELDAKLFTVIFDKRKAKVYGDENYRNETDPAKHDNYKIKNWFYGLAFTRLLPVINDYLKRDFEKAQKGILVFDKHSLDEKLSENIVKYLLGNIQGRELENICKFALYGISESVAGLQWADFITGVIRYWFEYEFASGIRLNKPDKDCFSKFDEIFKVVRKQMYYGKQREDEIYNGFIEVF